MNRLWVRLTLAFVGVTLVTALVVALLADVNVGSEFRRYLAARAGNTQDEIGMGRGSMAGRDMGMAGQGSMMTMMPAEQEFLDQTRVTVVLGALGAGIMGIVLGLVISRTIAAPLGKLADAARDFAGHDWKRRAPVAGASEIAEVARAFNAMADELERAEMLRRNLMADIAHELRTPLTVIQGSLRAMLDGLYPLELTEIASLYDETRLLGRLVADLRELALAEAGKQPLNMQPVDLVPVLQTVRDQFSLAAEAQETRMLLEETISLPPVYADSDRLAQVLHNLLANALRHTPGGTIFISGLRRDGHVQIRVADNGEGIAPDDLPHVFDRFYRADPSRTRATGSAGLGLAIARAWVEAMGGEIGVESTTGKGSTFWFTLPASPGLSGTG